MHRRIRLFSTAVIALLATAAPALGQGVDLTVFVGRAYPVYDERLTLRPSIPSLPGVDVTVTGTPEIRARGGTVFGGALAFELGIFGIEGRLDATDIGMDLTGARFDLRATQPPVEGLTGSVTVGDGRFDAERLYLLSVNGRLRTPGPIGFIVSGGLSYLPEIAIRGSAPLAVELAGVPLPGAEPQLRLRAAPGEPGRRFGVNVGAGLRAGGRVGLMGEVRVFHFREFGLRYGVDGASDVIADLLDSLAPVRFDPVIFHAQAGIFFRF